MAKAKHYCITSNKLPLVLMLTIHLHKKETFAHVLFVRNIEPLSARVSELEREVTKAEWDFRDRKLCRWAESKKGIEFNAEVIETGDSAKAIINSNDINGVVVNIKGDNLMLFDKIKLIITEVDIASATIMGNVI